MVESRSVEKREREEVSEDRLESIIRNYAKDANKLYKLSSA